MSGFGRSAFVFGQSYRPICCITYSFSTNLFLAYSFIVPRYHPNITTMLKRYRFFLIAAAAVATVLLLKRACVKLDTPEASQSPYLCFELFADFHLTGKHAAATSTSLSPVRECREGVKGTTLRSPGALLCP